MLFCPILSCRLWLIVLGIDGCEHGPVYGLIEDVRYGLADCVRVRVEKGVLGLDGIECKRL